MRHSVERSAVVSDQKRRYRRYTEEERAAALADIVLLGSSATSAKYDIPRSTLITWQEQFSIVHNPTIKKASIEDAFFIFNF